MTGVKFSGAKWLSRYVDNVSLLGVKVANVLGQVYRGIYHIDDHALRNKSEWSNRWVVTVTVFGQLATFDFNHLTSLVFCCQKAGLGVSVNGSWKGYTKLIFCEDEHIGETLGVDISECCYPESVSICGLSDFVGTCCRVKKTLYERDDHVSCSCEPLPWDKLQLLVNEAHNHAVRVAVEGRSPYSMEITFSKRDCNGTRMYDRHPGFKDHMMILEELVNVDYTSLG